MASSAGGANPSACAIADLDVTRSEWNDVMIRMTGASPAHGSFPCGKLTRSRARPRRLDVA